MNYSKLASKILNEIGGKDNVVSLVHCATRLRFNLRDDTIAHKENLINTQGVLGVVNSGGQYQIIIGNEVKEVYKELLNLGDFNVNISNENELESEQKSIVEKVLNTISGIFVPIVPVLAGAGMLKAVLSILTITNILSTESQSYEILNSMGDAGFYFLPILLAASAAKKFNCNQYLAMVIGGILLHPIVTEMITTAKGSGETISLLGLPVGLATYSSSVIPIILSVWFMSYVEPIIDRIVPKTIRIFMASLSVIFIVGVMTLVVIGPLGNILATALGIAIEFLNRNVSWLVPTLVGAFTPLMVMVGMHYGLIPIGINMLATTGVDTVAGPGMMVSNIAQGGAVLAVAIRAKSVDIKALASSTGISAVLGITEPAMYGVSLRFKKPLISAIVGGGLGGLFLGIMSVGRYAQVSPGIFALPSFIGPEGFSNFKYACIGSVIAFVSAFVLQLFLGIEETATANAGNNQELNETEINNSVIYSPIKGKVIELNAVNDEVFSTGALGKGVAIIPEEGKVYSPVSGTISAFFETGHAIGITSDAGIEILIHVGIDTVEMAGRNFTPKKKQGDRIRKGDLLLEFDKESIIKEGYEIVTPVIITNSNNYNEFKYEEYRDIQIGDRLIVIN